MEILLTVVLGWNEWLEWHDLRRKAENTNMGNSRKTMRVFSLLCLSLFVSVAKLILSLNRDVEENVGDNGSP